MPLQLNWVRCGDDKHWCSFQRVNLKEVTEEGVYLIWKDKKAIRVGQGGIADRLTDHRNNPDITRHGEMNVTWAAVEARYRDGVERYLGEHYTPLEGDRFPDAQPIKVNLPGD